MKAWLSLTVAEFRDRKPEDISAILAKAQMSRRLSGEPAQLRAWEVQVALLQVSLAASIWNNATIAFEYEMLRLEKRIDVVLITDRAIFVLEFKVGKGPITSTSVAQVVDYAQDLWDFHAGSREHPIVPILIQTEANNIAALMSGIVTFTSGVVPVVQANAIHLENILKVLYTTLPVSTNRLIGSEWIGAAYKPVPTIIEAAAQLFASNSVAEIAAARADTINLSITTEAIFNKLSIAKEQGQKVVIFVTGVPGAGKTLCGLNIVFGNHRSEGTAFLTGNAPLVSVLREALAYDRAGINLTLGPSNDPTRRAKSKLLRAARQETSQALQNVHRFLADSSNSKKPPAERVIVFDEAQRAWNEAQATRDTQRRKSTLKMSEPAHALEIMGRHEGFAAIVALIGNGQEINTGEAGLAEWGRVIAAATSWQAVAAQRTIEAKESAQRLSDIEVDWLTIDDALDLSVPIRSVRTNVGAAWVDAVLRNEVTEAAQIATNAGGVPYFVTRSLDEARDALRKMTPGLRRAGFVRSSGAKRLRAEGFDTQLVGPDEPVTWFLERWPDIRASDALEVCATEFSCQGLELDVVGLAWGGDLIRQENVWNFRSFVGHKWHNIGKDEDVEFVRNTYRVLLTRARYETVIWVPLGSGETDPFHDVTRPASQMDAIAQYFLDCGASILE
jgi:hypothetical protein